MRLRGENPVYKYADYSQSYDDSYSASYMGVATKTSLLLGIVAIVALYFSYRLGSIGFSGGMLGGLIVAPIVALIAVVVTHRVPAIAFFTTIVYALCEGVFLGVISALFAYYYGGEIVQMALMGTFGVLGGMLFLYSTGIIRVGAFFRRFMFSMLIGLIFSSLILLIVSLVSPGGFESFYSFYVGIVLISVIISSLYLLVDFDNVTRYVEAGAPKNMEWSLALGLVVTIVWIYIELLRFLAIIANRRR